MPTMKISPLTSRIISESRRRPYDISQVGKSVSLTERLLSNGIITYHNGRSTRPSNGPLTLNLINLIKKQG